jgi:hypothetical protein
MSSNVKSLARCKLMISCCRVSCVLSNTCANASANARPFSLGRTSCRVNAWTTLSEQGKAGVKVQQMADATILAGGLGCMTDWCSVCPICRVVRTKAAMLR